MAPILPLLPWWIIALRYVFPVALVAVVIHVVLLFYAWNPFEKHLYNHLGLPSCSFDNDILINLEKSWTEQKKSKEQIQNEIEKLQNILVYMSEGIIIINDTGKIVFFNPAVETILNYPVAIKNKYYWEVLINSKWTEEIRICLETESSIRGEIVITTPTEKILHYEITPIHKGKKNTQLLIKFSDLTHIRKLERVRADFVANVSHELRSPLTAILGFVETIKDQDSLEKDRMEKFLSIIHKNVIRLSDIVDDLLVLSKVESGEHLQYTRFVPSILIEELVELYRKKIQDKNQKIILNLHHEKDEISADRYQLRQVVINLLDNAIKYTHDGGEISVTQDFIGQNYLFHLQDNGIGIPYNDQGRIFERFYRVDKSRTGDTAGTGLGLSIVKNIVESHHGSITLKSELGKGSCFTVSIPIGLTEA